MKPLEKRAFSANSMVSSSGEFPVIIEKSAHLTKNCHLNEELIACYKPHLNTLKWYLKEKFNFVKQVPECEV